MKERKYKEETKEKTEERNPRGKKEKWRTRRGARIRGKKKRKQREKWRTRRDARGSGENEKTAHTRFGDKLRNCHTRFSVENRMHLICVPGAQFHTYDRLMSVISQDIAQNVQKMFINFYYTHEGRHEGLYTNNDNYEDATPSSSSTCF
jgi:hypothetical protein